MLFIVSQGCYFSVKKSHIHFGSISNAGSNHLPNRQSQMNRENKIVVVFNPSGGSVLAVEGGWV